MDSLYIYNLFPRLYKNYKMWIDDLDRIKGMGFNSIYINPIQELGKSRSIYAIKDYYSINKEFFILDKDDISREMPANEQLKEFIDACRQKQILLIMDLVVNHSAIDSQLTEDHKEWYNLNDEDDLIKPGAWQDGKWVIWADLASFDFESSIDKEGLWNYFLDVCRYYLSLGFNGFRCDAAYMVSSDFWFFLISKLREEYDNVCFIAETLGCTPVQIQALSTCGFDYIFNSSKWWNFNDPWCLEQYEITRNIAPSISFPETHDTQRLMAEVKYNEKIFLQRLYFSGIFSKGIQIPTGFEYGYSKRIDPVNTTFADREKTAYDYTTKIEKIIGIKNSLRPLHEESKVMIVDHPNWMNVFSFVKDWCDQHVLICINKDIYNPQRMCMHDINKILRSTKIRDYSPEARLPGYINNLDVNLNPAEIKIFAGEEIYIN